MRRLRHLLAASCCALLLSSASAYGQAGVNISWQECHADRAVMYRNFACDTNDGVNVAVGSFVAPAGVTQLTGNEIVIDMLTGTATPDWWRFRTAGSCRQSALSIEFVPRSPESNCRDLWAQQAAGGIGAYTIGYAGDPARARLVAAVAVPADLGAPLEEGVEYFSFNLVFSNIRTVGTGACTGCTLGVRIVLNSIKLTQPPGVGDFKLSSAADYGDGWRVEWQTPQIPDPVRNTTWGAVKALYR